MGKSGTRELETLTRDDVRRALHDVYGLSATYTLRTTGFEASARSLQISSNAIAALRGLGYCVTNWRYSWLQTHQCRVGMLFERPMAPEVWLHMESVFVWFAVHYRCNTCTGEAWRAHRPDDPDSYVRNPRGADAADRLVGVECRHFRREADWVPVLWSPKPLPWEDN